MPSTLSRYLRRFRFQGVPGAPAGAAVPMATRAALLEAELAPVFAALEEAQAAADALVEAARNDALRIRQQGVQSATALLERARREEVSVRQRAADAVLAAAKAECDALVARGIGEAERTERIAAGRLAHLAHVIAESVLDLAATAQVDPDRPGR